MTTDLVMEMIFGTHVYGLRFWDVYPACECVWHTGIHRYKSKHSSDCACQKGSKNNNNNNNIEIPKLLLHTIYPLFMLENMYEQTYLYIYKFEVEA